MTKISLIFFACITQAAWSQNVGVGITAPAMKLHVSGAADTALLLLDNKTALDYSTSVGLYFRNGDWFTGGIKTIGTANNASRLGLFTYAADNISNLKERLTITDNGMVGINKINPLYTLDVAGSLQASQSSTVNYTATILNPVSRGKGALRVAMGNSTGLSIGNATLVAENDTSTGIAIRAVAKYISISAESNTPSRPSLFVTNSAGTSPLAALFYGNVEISATTFAPGASGNLKVSGNLILPKDAGGGKVLTSDGIGEASWQNGVRVSKAVLSQQYILPGPSEYKLPFTTSYTDGFDDIGSFDNAYNQFTPNQGGCFLVTASVGFRMTDYTGLKYFSISIVKNGYSLMRNNMNMEYSSQQGAVRTVSVTGVVKLNAGDYMYVAAAQQTGITQPITSYSECTFFNIVRLY